MSRRYLAFDLGAESGRAILGSLKDGTLTLEELHRFPNTPVRVVSGLHWDALRLFHEICHGLTIAGRDRRLALDGSGSTPGASITRCWARTVLCAEIRGIIGIRGTTGCSRRC